MKKVETLKNQFGQPIEITRIDTKTKKVSHVRFNNLTLISNIDPYKQFDVFEGSEFNPVLLADGTIIPYYKYDGQAIKKD